MHTLSSYPLNRRQLARALFGAVAAPALAAKPSSYLVYLGTYTGPKSKGIYVTRFDPASGKLDPIKLAGEVEQPSWVTLHPNGRYLYAVSELGGTYRGRSRVSPWTTGAAS